MVLEARTRYSTETSDSLEVLALADFAHLPNSSCGHAALLQITRRGADTEVEHGSYLQIDCLSGNNASHFT